MRRLALLALTLAPATLAQEPPPDPAPLRGPSVTPAASPSPMIERDFDGSVRLPDGTLEERAIELMNLEGASATPEDRRAAEAIRSLLARRARVLEDFVYDNTALLTELDTAGHTGNKADQLRLLAEAYRKLAPLREAGPLDAQVRAALPEARRAEFDGLLQHYWDALIADRTSRPGADGKVPGRLQAIAGTRIELLGKEIERSFLRLIGSGQYVYRVATRGLTLRPEQARRLHELLDAHMEATKGNDDAQAGQRLFARALGVLDEDQRPVMIRNLRGLGQAKPRRPEPARDASGGMLPP